MDPGSLWRYALEDLEARLTPHTLATWFKPVLPVGLASDELTLCVPNQFHADWLSSHYGALIAEHVSGRRGGETRIRFVVSAEAPAPGDDPKAAASPGKLSADGASRQAAPAKRRRAPVREAARTTPLHLNPKYTFNHFVVGTSNQFANAACTNVGNNPGSSYNPLVIFGGVGLGKTHLLHAVGHQALQRDAALRVHCVTSEQFMNEFINSLSNNRIDAFREKWRGACDVLLVDDIQFIAGKDRTQEEFFHTFNSLHDAGRQIVLTCDKMPKDIPGLEERLLTRFHWGLIADIKVPEFETRVAILRHKAEQEHVELPEEVAYLLAKRIASNVRELEGALTRLVAFSGFSGEPISVEFTRSVLSDLFNEARREISVDDIQRAVAQFYGLKTADLKSRRRHKTIVKPRQVAMYLCRQLTSASYPDIGSRFGGKDHSTVISAVRKIERLLEEDAALRDSVGSIEKTLVS